ncbi:hypothetical protein Ancab_021124 [Ancistrocladus abbreviatus]
MEESLLLKEGVREIRKWEVVGEEMKKVGFIAGPMVAVHMSQSLLKLVLVTMVGHLGELPLASTALAISLASFTGHSLLMGMASALETLCGQAYGAQQYQKLGTKTYTAIFCLMLTCIPISLLWIYMEELLILIGQDPWISHEAAKFLIWSIPALFAYATLQPLVRFFQSQSLIIPMLFSSFAALCLHLPLCWVLVFKFSLNNLGAAVAMDIAMWLNVVFLVSYMKFSPVCAKTRSLISVEVFQGVGEFFRFAIPSAAMICLEWWAFELIILLSGLLPNPALETSVLSVCLTTTATLYAIPYGVGAAASTRVSNELGAANPQGARIAVLVVMSIAAIAAIIVSSAIFATRQTFGYVFSNDKQVVECFTSMVPLVCISILRDNMHGPLCGVARGCGWQDIAAFVVLGSYYLCGIPLAAILGFWMALRGRGLWIGIQTAAILQTTLLAVVTCFVDWEKRAIRARERLFEVEKRRTVDQGVI